MSKLPRRAVNLEADALLATQERPKPFENRSQLYVMHFFFAFVSRMWDMGIVLLVADITNNSLFLIALTGLSYALAVFLLMGSIGSFLDKSNRIVAVRLALLAKILAVTTAYLVCAYLTHESAATTIISPERRKMLLYSIPLLGAAAGLSFSAITQSIEKDWIVVLSAKDSVWLASTNSIMTQIDLACSSLAPVVTGILFANYSYSFSAIVLIMINAVSSLALYFYMSHLYYAWPALGQKVGVDVLDAAEDLNQADNAELGDLDEEDQPATLPPGYGTTSTTVDGKSRLSVRSAAELTAQQTRRMSADAVQINRQTARAATTGSADDTPCCGSATCCACLPSARGGVFFDFLQSGCTGMMVSYAALYLTVLSFGSIMTVYIRWAGVSDDRIGLFRGLAALFGYLGAVLYPWVSEWLGLWMAAQIAIAYQFTLVALAASAFFWEPDKGVTVYIVIFAVLLSRTGLWMFDLCVRQIAQETIHESVRGKVNGQWRSMTAFFEMAGYAAAAFVPDPQHFWVLTTLSASMIGFALVVFTLTSPRNAECCACCVGSGNSSNSGSGVAGGVRIGPGEGYRSVPAAEGGSSGKGASAGAVAGAGGPSQYKPRRNGESLGGLEMQPGTNVGNSGKR